jgi:hypothetical protein
MPGSGPRSTVEARASLVLLTGGSRGRESGIRTCDDRDSGPRARGGEAGRSLAVVVPRGVRDQAGVPIFPGSLNVGLDAPFGWFDPRWDGTVVQFPAIEYGGERDILLLPCSLSVAPGVPAFLWSTTTAARDPADRLLAEVISPVHLRSTYGLKDGDPIAIHLILGARHPDAANG